MTKSAEARLLIATMFSKADESASIWEAFDKLRTVGAIAAELAPPTHYREIGSVNTDEVETFDLALAILERIATDIHRTALASEAAAASLVTIEQHLFNRERGG